jgi:hypothetical protein
LEDAPQLAEFVEEPVGPGIQPQDLPFKGVPKALSNEDKEEGLKTLHDAYQQIDSSLKQIETQIAVALKAGPRRLLTLVGGSLGDVSFAVEIE